MTAIEGLMSIINDWEMTANLFFSIMATDGYKDLLLVLLAGEITLITLFFALIPNVLEKRHCDYYLGIKENDFFLFQFYQKGELLNTWISAAIILIIDIICCFFELIVWGYIFSAIFFTYMICRICYFLGYISNNSEVIEAIVLKTKNEIENDHSEVLERMVETSIEDWKAINENLQFLEKQNEGANLIGEYIDGLFEANTVHEKKIFDKVKDLINNHKNCYNLQLDSYEIYRFFRNNLGDFNKEEYYYNMYALIVNDFNLYIKDYKTTSHLVTVVIQAIDSSNMSERNKYIVKEFVIRKMYMALYQYKTQKIDEEEYYNKYKYYFTFIKYFIDEEDVEAFELFLQINGDSDYDNTFLLDIYMTCMVYFYYLIEIESDYYVDAKKKYVAKKMKEKLDERFDLNHIIHHQYFFDVCSLFVANLKKMSKWWDIMKMNEVKTCKVPEMIDSVIKSFILIFGKSDIYDKYEFSPEIVDMFKFDIKWGKVDKKERFNKFFEFVKYDFKDDDYEEFELQYATYVVKTYKEEELKYEIDENQLKLKLLNDQRNLEEELSDLNIFNDKKCNDFYEENIRIKISRTDLNEYWENRSVLPIETIKRMVEESIYKRILGTVKEKNYGGISEWRKIPYELNNATRDYYYLRPISDRLGHIRDIKEIYNEALGKLNIVDTTISNVRLLVEDFSCNFVSLDIKLEELGNATIKELKEDLCLSENEYYQSNEDGIEIPYSSEEIDNMLKKTYKWIVVNVKYGLDVKGENNIAFIQGPKPKDV